MPAKNYQPTEETRKRVKLLAGLALSQEQICVLIGLRSPKTLRRYFSGELALGPIESDTSVRQTAFKLAASRTNPRMTAFWLKTRAGWSPGMAINRETEGDEHLIYVYEDYTLVTVAEGP